MNNFSKHFNGFIKALNGWVKISNSFGKYLNRLSCFFFNKVCLTGWLDDINDIHDWSLIVWFGVQITAILYFIHSVDLRFTKTDTVLLLGCPASPVINSVFGRLWRKTASRGREDTRVWYRETMFSQMVPYDFSLHGALHGYFLYLVSALSEKPTRRCEPEEGYLRCLKRFDHRSHSIIFLLFEVKSVRWCWRWETQRNAHVAYKPTRRSR